MLNTHNIGLYYTPTLWCIFIQFYLYCTTNRYMQLYDVEEIGVFAKIFNFNKKF